MRGHLLVPPLFLRALELESKFSFLCRCSRSDFPTVFVFSKRPCVNPRVCPAHTHPVSHRLGTTGPPYLHTSDSHS
eukprot:3489524-Rhodomonas_salina.2